MPRTDLKTGENFVDHYDCDDIEFEISYGVDGIDGSHHLVNMNDAVAYSDDLPGGELNFGTHIEQFKVCGDTDEATKKQDYVNLGKKSDRVSILSEELRRELYISGYDIGEDDDEEE